MFNKDIKILAGPKKIIKKIDQPFNKISIEFLNELSKNILTNNKAKEYPDLITFAFWARRKNILSLSKNYSNQEIRLGLGTIFHITPSNMPVNFIYSFAFSLLSGNSNIVRVSDKDFPQVKIFINTFKKISKYKKFKNVACSNLFVRYIKNIDITSYFSSLCDGRIIWGGDKTVEEIQKIQLPAKSKSIHFPDRFSLCVLNSSGIKKLKTQDLKILIKKFYNDTYVMDQNACTAPQLVIWVGKVSHTTKSLFWKTLEIEVKNKYKLENIFSLNKYNQLLDDILNKKIIKKTFKHKNFIYRVLLNKIPNNFNIEDLRGKWGYYYEYEVNKLDKIASLVNSKFQTMSYFGFSKQSLKNFVKMNKISGIDRIVPIGRTLDMGIVWDGYDLPRTLSRVIDLK